MCAAAPSPRAASSPAKERTASTSLACSSGDHLRLGTTAAGLLRRLKAGAARAGAGAGAAEEAKGSLVGVAVAAVVATGGGIGGRGYGG